MAQAVSPHDHWTTGTSGMQATHTAPSTRPARANNGLLAGAYWRGRQKAWSSACSGSAFESARSSGIRCGWLEKAKDQKSGFLTQFS